MCPLRVAVAVVAGSAPVADEGDCDHAEAWDKMRSQCPVAYSDSLGWALLRHADVMEALLNPDAYSNVVSAHLNVPNGMDPPRHTSYRATIEPYFSSARMQKLEPTCREIAERLVNDLPSNDGEVEFISAFAQKFALDMQCAFTGWPRQLREPLRLWTQNHQQATLAGDRVALTKLASEFHDDVAKSLAARRSHPEDDISTELVCEKVDGRSLTDEEIVSILRNWTVGELATITAALGIVAYHLCKNPTLQSRLREVPEETAAAIEEILRMDAPLLSNRRKTTRDVKIGGRQLKQGDRVTLMWASANRDESAFPEADSFRPRRDQQRNLLYGAGIHGCPGAPLARLELRVAVECLLAGTTDLKTSIHHTPVRAEFPAAGFACLPLRVSRSQGLTCH